MHSNSNHDLTLEQLPNGQCAWLRPPTDKREADDALYVVTDLGRRELAMEALSAPGPPSLRSRPRDDDQRQRVRKLNPSETVAHQWRQIPRIWCRCVCRRQH